jgi:hypothetical protein
MIISVYRIGFAFMANQHLPSMMHFKISWTSIHSKLTLRWFKDTKGERKIVKVALMHSRSDSCDHDDCLILLMTSKLNKMDKDEHI